MSNPDYWNYQHYAVLNSAIAYPISFRIRSRRWVVSNHHGGRNNLAIFKAKQNLPKVLSSLKEINFNPVLLVAKEAEAALATVFTPVEEVLERLKSLKIPEITSVLQAPGPEEPLCSHQPSKKASRGCNAGSSSGPAEPPRSSSSSSNRMLDPCEAGPSSRPACPHPPEPPKANPNTCEAGSSSGLKRSSSASTSSKSVKDPKDSKEKVKSFWDSAFKVM